MTVGEPTEYRACHHSHKTIVARLALHSINPRTRIAQLRVENSVSARASQPLSLLSVCSWPGFATRHCAIGKEMERRKCRRDLDTGSATGGWLA
jgi:hypothetical protein